MLRRTCKTICTLLAVLLLFSVCPTFFAAEQDVDFERMGSISLTLRSSSGSHQTVPGGSFTLYQIATVDSENANLSYTFTEEFKNSGASLSNLLDQSLAEHLASHARINSITGTNKKANGAGRLVFDSLPVGLYLIIQNGSTSGWYPIAPFVISIPMTNAEGTGWVYDAEASPKAEPKPDTPDTDDETKMTVRKIWTGDISDHPDSVKIHLMRDGEVYDTVTLSDSNRWRHTWNHLNDKYRWSVAEAEVPDGYTVSYSGTGAVVIVENYKEPKMPDNPEKLTVKKVWEDDDAGKRPTGVTIQLWNGSTLYDTVVLGDANDWTHTWTDLPRRADWHIYEVDVPDYADSYSVDGLLITITNTHITVISGDPDPGSDPPSLIQTGQLNWPVPVLAGAGVLLLLIGWLLVFGKRKHHDA